LGKPWAAAVYLNPRHTAELPLSLADPKATGAGACSKALVDLAVAVIVSAITIIVWTLWLPRQALPLKDPISTLSLRLSTTDPLSAAQALNRFFIDLSITIFIDPITAIV